MKNIIIILKNDDEFGYVIGTPSNSPADDFATLNVTNKGGVHMELPHAPKFMTSRLNYYSEKFLSVLTNKTVPQFEFLLRTSNGSLTEFFENSNKFIECFPANNYEEIGKYVLRNVLNYSSYLLGDVVEYIDYERYGKDYFYRRNGKLVSGYFLAYI